MTIPRLPVIVLTGYLVAGKTTRLSRNPRGRERRGLAIVVYGLNPRTARAAR